MQKTESKSLNSSPQSIKCSYHDLVLFNRVIFIPASVSCTKPVKKEGAGRGNHGDTKESSFKKKVGNMLWKRESTMVSLFLVVSNLFAMTEN